MGSELSWESGPKPGHRSKTLKWFEPGILHYNNIRVFGIRNTIKAQIDRNNMQINVIVEKHSDGYVAYPLGFKGVVVGEGDNFEEALADVKSAIKFHLETFGSEVFEIDSPVLGAFTAETEIEANA